MTGMLKLGVIGAAFAAVAAGGGDGRADAVGRRAGVGDERRLRRLGREGTADPFGGR